MHCGSCRINLPDTSGGIGIVRYLGTTEPNTLDRRLPRDFSLRWGGGGGGNPGPLAVVGDIGRAAWSISRSILKMVRGGRDVACSGGQLISGRLGEGWTDTSKTTESRVKTLRRTCELREIRGKVCVIEVGSLEYADMILSRV